MKSDVRRRGLEVVIVTEAVLISYMSIGLVAAIFTFVFSGKKQAEQSDSNLERLGILVQMSNRSRTPLQWLRYEILRVVSSFVMVIMWPMLVPHFVRGMRIGAGSATFSYRQFRANLGLSGLHVATSVNVALFAVLLVLLRMGSPAEWTIDLGCYLILVSLASRLAFSWLQGTDLPSMMRTNLLHPYVQFALVALIDYLGLLLAALALDWRDGQTLSVSVLVDQARNVAVFSHVGQIFRAVPNTLDSIMITIGALTFAVMIIGQASRFKQFKRTPKDHAVIIMNLMAVGKRPAAIARLRKLNIVERGDSSMVAPRIWAAIMEGRYQEAYEFTEADFVNNSGSNRLEYDSRTTDDICRRLILFTFGVVEFSADEHRALIRYAIDRGITDGCLCLVLSDLADFGIFASKDDLTSAGIDEKYPLTLGLCEAVLFGSDTIASLLRDIIEAFSTVDPDAVTDRIVRESLLVVYQLRIGPPDEAVLAQLLDHLERAASVPGWLAVSTCIFLVQIDQGLAPHHVMVPRVRAQLARIAAEHDEDEFQRLRLIAEKVHAGFVGMTAGSPPEAAEAVGLVDKPTSAGAPISSD